jgi:hypothetical protein
MLREFETQLAIQIADGRTGRRTCWRVADHAEQLGHSEAPVRCRRRAGGADVLSPLMLVLAVLVRAKTPGRRCSSRNGWGGRTVFRCAKFGPWAAGRGEGTVTTAADARVTPLGRFLRRWKLDGCRSSGTCWRGGVVRGAAARRAGVRGPAAGRRPRILELRPGITGPATLLFRDEERLLALAKNPQAFNDAVVYPEKVRLNREYLEDRQFLARSGLRLGDGLARVDASAGAGICGWGCATANFPLASNGKPCATRRRQKDIP